MNAECTLIDKISTDPEKDFLKKWKTEFYLRDHQVLMSPKAISTIKI